MEIKENQIWRYNNNELDKDSFVIIRKIDLDCVHVTVTNIFIDDKFVEIAHIPINPEKLILSLKENQKVSFMKENSFNEGYQEWLKVDGGIWNKSLKEVIDAIKDSIS